MTVLLNVGVGDYFECNVRAQTESYEDGRPAAAGTAPNC